MKFRVERDPLGDVRVPVDAYYGAQTPPRGRNFPHQRALRPSRARRWTVQSRRPPPSQRALRRLPSDIANAIVRAADEILRVPCAISRGRVYQAGAGTSHNMNANEVLATAPPNCSVDCVASTTRVHPNDHVNMDSRPTTCSRTPRAVPARDGSRASRLGARARGRLGLKAARLRTYSRPTHAPAGCRAYYARPGIRGLRRDVTHAADDLERSAMQLRELNLGATAVGTGLNAGDDYVTRAISNLQRYTGTPVRPAANRFRVTQSMGDVLAFSGTLRRLAVEINKIASDLRLLSSGPRAGIAEIQLPPVQPGSSIMPGKVNPSVPEMVNQVCFQVYGCDAAILAAADAGQLELNVMMPVLAWNAIHATRILTNAMRVLQDRCIVDTRADEARCRELLDRSTALATALIPYTVAATADIAQTSVRQAVNPRARARTELLPVSISTPSLGRAMTSPGVPCRQLMTTQAPTFMVAAPCAASAFQPRSTRTLSGPRTSQNWSHRSLRVAAPRQDHGRAGVGEASVVAALGAGSAGSTSTSRMRRSQGFASPKTPRKIFRRSRSASSLA